MSVAAGVRGEVGALAVAALILVATQQGRPTGLDGVEHLPMVSGQPVGAGIRRQAGAQHLAKLGPGAAPGPRVLAGITQGRCLDLRELAGLGELQQLERALDLGQALLAHVQIDEVVERLEWPSNRCTTVISTPDSTKWWQSCAAYAELGISAKMRVREMPSLAS